MIEVIYNSSAKKNDRIAKKEIRRFVKFCTEHFNLQDELHLTIEICDCIVMDKPEPLIKGRLVQPECPMNADNPYYMGVKWRGNKKEVLSTIAHEMTHLAQYEDGIFKKVWLPIEHKWHYMWDAELYSFEYVKKCNFNHDDNKASWKALPWEKEAIKSQKEIIKKWEESA